ncbi:serine/threonine-protein kinase [Paradevosia shaoguanensis]|uniref:serine/threonine-protein kinase n=1 Tax=Paradevosia shaoguanensis TaxID=1335043 RepID=UPI003C75EF58
MEIKLEREVWQFDESRPLGPPGGFGEVFKGRGKLGEVAIKRLKITAADAAHRELKVGKSLAGRTLENVVPILDYGQDAETDRYYLVMPVCDYSLADKLRDSGIFTWDEARSAALDIISGLEEVDDLVHRDLKPANVLWLDGRWRVADFGIAKFVEDSTSIETMRDALTPAYAAPEQWRGEAPTRATDVYALGCILHALLNGHPPFDGDMLAIRKAHLEQQPSDLDGAPTRLNGLFHTMLRKSHSSRPSLARCAEVIRGPSTSATQSPAAAALAEAGKAISQAEALAEAKRQREIAEVAARKSMGDEATADLTKIMARLFKRIEQASEAVRTSGKTIRLGRGELLFTDIQTRTQRRQDAGSWDVVAFTTARIACQIEQVSAYQPNVYSFGATLAYAAPKGEFRWWEMGFWSLGGNRSHETPFAVLPDGSDFQRGVEGMMHSVSLAYGPLPIDGEDEEAFFERWIHLFAKAAIGKLRYPGVMPLPSTFFTS